jgi:hypothetical protein
VWRIIDFRTYFQFNWLFIDFRPTRVRFDDLSRQGIQNPLRFSFIQSQIHTSCPPPADKFRET